MHQLTANVKTVLSIAPQSAAAAEVKGGGVDCSGFSRATLLFTLGALTQTKTADCKLQHSDTDVDGNYADIADAALTQVIGGAADTDKVYAIEIVPAKKFLRPVATIGAAGTGLIAAMVILHQAGESPATAAAAGLAERVIV